VTTIERRTVIALAAIVAGLLCVPGCATVRPYERERLSSRIMTFDADAKALARRTKSLEAREGSTGGVGGAGGGCACSN
jgi:hypothetical protein